MNKKGQVTVEALLAVPILIIMLFISLEMFAAVTTGDNMLYDTLDNAEKVPQYGGTAKLLLYLVPLLMVVVVIIGFWNQAKRPDYGY